MGFDSGGDGAGLVEDLMTTVMVLQGSLPDVSLED